MKDDNVIYYIRSNKELIGFKYNEDVYYYIKNNQDDIIGILDNEYNVVAKYTYDSWGNIISITDENNNDVSENNTHIANINPYRYRSYYYDRETKLYYLNSRYYNPEWGRFINVDNYVSTDTGILGYNMYLYCNNNCINYNDDSGHAVFAGLVIGLAVIGTGFLLNTISRMKKAKKEVKKVQSKKNIPDRTKEVDKLLNDNAQTILRYTYDGQPISQKLITFKNKVQSNADMDLKNKPEFQETISYKGIIMEPQDLGNFNYGYIGRAYGFSTDLLLLGASYQQVKDNWTNPVTYINCFTPSLCDDPRDTYFIKLGAIKYDQEN